MDDDREQRKLANRDAISIGYDGPAPNVFAGGAIGGGLGAVFGFLVAGPIGAAIFGDLGAAIIGGLSAKEEEGLQSK